jgi:hypothetical protein
LIPARHSELEVYGTVGNAKLTQVMIRKMEFVKKNKNLKQKIK